MISKVYMHESQRMYAWIPKDVYFPKDLYDSQCTCMYAWIPKDVCMDHKEFMYDLISKVCMYHPKGCLNPKDSVHY